MFTGLVETIGTVSEYSDHDTSISGSNGVSLTIEDAISILSDVHLGDSISTNGVCLTVTQYSKEDGTFKVGIAPETLRRSNLGDLKSGSKVNLERAVSGETRLGGHVVQGHVDTIAKVIAKNADGNAMAFTYQLRDKSFINYIVEKGFVAIDGTSLTITDVDYKKSEFSIMLVGYTQSKVIMPLKGVGDFVNIEVDLTGKLIEKQIDISLQGQIERHDSPLNKMISQLIDAKIKEALRSK